MATTSVVKNGWEASEEIRITRACQTLHRAFLAYREATWSRFCKEVLTPKTTGMAACIMNDPTMAGRRNGWFCDFPHHLVPDPMIKGALLTIMSSHDIGFMKKLTEQMFEGLDVNIEEVKVRLKPHGFRTIIMYERGRTDFNDYDFWFMRVTMRTTGRQIALNIAGLQFGISNVTPWETHNNAYVDKILAVKPFGTLAEFTSEVAETKGLTGMQYDISVSAMQAWHDSVDPAMEKKGLSWALIFKKFPDDFARHRDKVLKVGKKAMETWVADQRLTKRRLKAERYDERHEEELTDIMDELSVKYLDVNVKVKLERALAFPKILKG